MHSTSDYLEYDSNDRPSLTLAGAEHLASLVLKSINREYPNKIAHLMESDADIAPPRQLHPAFYGCFDWHSSVHGHWMLVRLLKEFSELSDSQAIRDILNDNLQTSKIQGELDYMTPPSRHAFERTYGWAWLLKLAEELRTWEDFQGSTWAKNLEPFVRHIENLFIEFLPRQTYPIRTGTHPNTAFGLSLAWDYSLAATRYELKSVILNTAKKYYSSDSDYPAHYEPCGTDFLSPCLEEASLMQRILDTKTFGQWFETFLPQIPDTLSSPAKVSDRTDGQLVHLDGLNLSRAWCFQEIANTLEESNPRKQELRRLAAKHLKSALPHVASGNYEGEHWLATFAVYALSVPK